MDLQKDLEAVKQESHELRNRLLLKEKIAKELADEVESTYKAYEYEKTQRGNKDVENRALRAQVDKLQDELYNIKKFKEEREQTENSKIKELELLLQESNTARCTKELFESADDTFETQKSAMDEAIASSQSYKEMLRQEELANVQLIDRVKTLEAMLAEKHDMLQSKIDILEEIKVDRDRLLEEKLIMSGELAVLKEKPADENRRGNSLFAELEDNRKLMEVRLKAVLGKYAALKKMFLSKNDDARRLREQQGKMYREWHDINDERKRNDNSVENAHLKRIEDLERDVRRLELRPESPQIVTLSIDNVSQLKWVQQMVVEKRKEADMVRKELQSRSLNDWMRERKIHQLTTQLLKQKQLAIEKETKRNAEMADASTSPGRPENTPNDFASDGQCAAKKLRFEDNKENTN